LLTVYIGKAWTSDYGDPHDAHDFDFIHPISPVHNVPMDRKLPPTILLTADRKCQNCIIPNKNSVLIAGR
jgi:prolyl oligopeptidase PreP (S9A serine peptidase family)